MSPALFWLRSTATAILLWFGVGLLSSLAGEASDHWHKVRECRQYDYIKENRCFYRSRKDPTMSWIVARNQGQKEWPEIQAYERRHAEFRAWLKEVR